MYREEVINTVLPSGLHKRGETILDIKLDNLNFDLLRLVDETGQYMEYNLRAELAINEANLPQEMLQQPAKYVYWSSILEKLKLFQESQELQLEITWAKLDEEARDYLTRNGTKPTKDIVEAYIKRQPQFEAAQKNINQYNYLVGYIGRIVKAFEQRKDMLQSYGKQLADGKFFGAGAGSKLEEFPRVGGHQ